MALRTAAKQSAHDDAVRTAGQMYRERGRQVWLNPDGEKNMELGGLFIDVIAAANPGRGSTWVTEVETEDSVTDAEAKSQWVRYGEAYPSWHLAVPVSQYEAAMKLVVQHGVQHCKVIMWDKNPSGTHTFWGLPGLSAEGESATSIGP